MPSSASANPPRCKANSQKSAGTGTGIEVTRAQVQLANDRQKLIVAQKDRRKAVMELLRAMGLSLDAGIEFTDKLSYAPVDVGTLEASLDKARKERSELQAQQRRQEAARLNLGSVAAERLPSAAAFGLANPTPSYLMANRKSALGP